MNRFVERTLATAAVFAMNMTAWAGSSGSPPGGDQGSSGSEPALIALIVFSLIPGIYFVRRAMAAQPVRTQDR